MTMEKRTAFSRLSLREILTQDRLKNRSQQDGPRFQPWFHPYIQDDTHLAFEYIYLLPFLRLLLLPSTIPLLRIKTWYQHHLD